MSREDVEVVQRLFSALDSEDWQGALGVFDPAVEMLLSEGEFHGLDGVVSAFTDWLDAWDEHRIEPEEFVEGQDRVLAVIHLTGRGAGSGVEVDQRFFQVYSVRNGKIVRMVEFVKRADALSAVGIRE